VAVALVIYSIWRNWPERPPPIAGDGRPATFLFCSWNVENFFDDTDDPKNHDGMENWFGTDSAAFRDKVNQLADGLLRMNGGVGPDIACLVEVESERSMSALRDALNARLEAAGAGNRKYGPILFRDNNTGRRFAPGILSRVGVTTDRTRRLGAANRNNRILEGHLHHNGYELIVLVAHWTSRVTDGPEDGSRRMSYANDCYGRVNEILHSNPDADVIVCGDFNDEFKDASMQTGLRATDDLSLVRNASGEPRLLALFASWSGDPPGTIYGRGKWSVFDHICTTRGLLDDRGWGCDPNSATVFAPDQFRRESRRREPFEFGSRNDTGPRGYSDHFPVTVRLTVDGVGSP
jgi:endonuclease/exonuclease/phosphatase family metal-dependent hydrolase